MGKMVAIYRVEHRLTGKGPYGGSEDIPVRLRREHTAATGHPSWQWDHIPVLPLHGSGFDSLDKLMTWFAGYMDALVDAGYYIRVFYVDQESVFYSKSGKQVAFPRFGYHDRTKKISPSDEMALLKKEFIENVKHYTERLLALPPHEAAKRKITAAGWEILRNPSQFQETEWSS